MPKHENTEWLTNWRRGHQELQGPVWLRSPDGQVLLRDLNIVVPSPGSIPPFGLSVWQVLVTRTTATAADVIVRDASWPYDELPSPGRRPVLPAIRSVLGVFRGEADELRTRLRAYQALVLREAQVEPWGLAPPHSEKPEVGAQPIHIALFDGLRSWRLELYLENDAVTAATLQLATFLRDATVSMVPTGWRERFEEPVIRNYRGGEYEREL